MNRDRINAIIAGFLILFAYLVILSSVVESKIIGMLFEALSGLAVIGIAVIMFPYFKQFSKVLSIEYISFKVIEGLLMIIAGILLLINGLSLREGIYTWHAYIFIIGALLFYYLLYKSSLIPRWISVWGIIAAFLLLIANLMGNLSLPMFIMIIGYAPIIINEVFLAFYLIIKGFREDKNG